MVRKKLTCLSAIGVALLVFIAGCNGPTTMISAGHLISYRVEGSAARANVEYLNLEGESVELAAISLPWSVEVVDGVPYGDSVPYYLSAQKLEPDAVGTVIVAAFVDGTLQQTDQTQESFGFVAVYGEAP